MNPKEDLLEVLLHLFENFKIAEVKPNRDPETLEVKLTATELPEDDLQEVVQWLKNLLANQSRQPQATSIRIYSTKECEKLNRDCRGFLLLLEQLGVLTPITRESVLNYVMSLDTTVVALEQLKLVILMVLFNRPGQEAACAWMEKMFYEEYTGYSAH